MARFALLLLLLPRPASAQDALRIAASPVTTGSLDPELVVVQLKPRLFAVSRCLEAPSANLRLRFDPAGVPSVLGVVAADCLHTAVAPMRVGVASEPRLARVQLVRPDAPAPAATEAARPARRREGPDGWLIFGLSLAAGLVGGLALTASAATLDDGFGRDLLMGVGLALAAPGLIVGGVALMLGAAND